MAEFNYNMLKNTLKRACHMKHVKHAIHTHTPTLAMTIFRVKV